MNYKLTLSYEGTRYKGWQRLKNNPDTIQGKLEETLSRLCHEAIEINGSGRTDAGVHALNQVCNFKTNFNWRLDDLKNQLNRFLPEDVSVLNAEKVDERFHARFSAKTKTYAYRIWTAEYRPVFERRWVYASQEGKLDVNAMETAAKVLVGTHDFKPFSSDRTKKSTVRTLYQIDFEETETELVIRYTGDGFLHNMVRILTGTLIEVGQHKREAVDPESVQDRSVLGFTAPACGLTLESVKY
ncbi:tRNA pseudouridine(38-40) synthase TruA [Fusibacter tunisiensis]|uniref:tRNA pseudouridine synthase A n=1 Tax=Fusibacter tunisiensis TaxID=1008308 RepID=A0ABS2MRV5_9FIRM|nr:tRNA pseudouridine38-40 synthase [Fusibacter tunisiensis]